MRFQKREELFEIRCRKCGSSDVDVYGWECPDCGVVLEFHCNDCDNYFNPHEFKRVGEIEQK